ncbi:hypothetical protein G7Y89_g1344 [Cudoniella acicularis]|uniref:DUF6604 domain-containing protein n=1 Tax=Cudoniella acicularis TaxID=354080 RepID=A0A8H4RX91_9HELO|nr:hypothetical protein G7Y89_g1344 [Cudoniella acicularis]
MGGKEHAQFNETYRAAIRLFRETLDISVLKGPHTPIRKRMATVEDDAEDLLKTANPFEGLNIEESTSNYDKPAPPKETPNFTLKAESAGRNYQYKYPHEEEFIALYFYYKDLNEIRSYLKQLWKDYQDRKVDLVSVSLTTDIAIDVVERMEVDFFSTLWKPQPDDHLQ